MYQVRTLASAAVAFAIACIALTASAAAPDTNHARVCSVGNSNEPRCHALVLIDRDGRPVVTPPEVSSDASRDRSSNRKPPSGGGGSSLPPGLSPAQLHAAYNLPTNASAPTVIAIVDAYDHSNIYNDLTTYSQTYGLPILPQCTSSLTSQPCFKKVNQNGGTSYPSVNSGWALEIALDVEAAHATCQNCSILLVEANTANYTDLMAAEDRAASMGAKVISNSWGSSEFSGETSFDSHFNIPGVAVTVSSGDNGYGVQYPASSPYVTAVGGTSLKMSGTTFTSETAWSGAGSGCSAYEPKPLFQHDTNCANRTVADVSAVADPNTGAAVYDSVPYNGRSGWFVVGGTSLAAPVIAGTYALSGNTVNANAIPYMNTSALRDITSGSNGSCSGSYLCTALAGFDGPTGLGTPQGIAAF